eukprot:3979092-Prymnesium_polylepis.1
MGRRGCQDFRKDDAATEGGVTGCGLAGRAEEAGQNAVGGAHSGKEYAKDEQRRSADDFSVE